MTDLWAYTSRCDGDYCPGDCDRCGKAEEIYEEQSMGAIKGFFVGKDGKVQTYWTNEVIADPVVPTPDLWAKELVILDGAMPKQRKDWKKKRKKEIRHTLVRASLFGSLLAATLFTMSLAGSNPNWAVGIGGATVNMAWFFTVLMANGGKINVER